MQKHQNRILFLKEFTKQLIVNSAKYVEILVREKEEIFVPVGLEKEFQKSIAETKMKTLIQPKLPIKPRLKLLAKPVILAKLKLIKPVAPAGYETSLISKPEVEMPLSVHPQATILPPSFNLGKLNFLISDPRVNIIECPGPDKFLLARTLGQTSVTKISLSQEEIQNTIEAFSREAKIPVLSGLFKAIIGNLVITAVISELVGSRFIITKITPYSILEQQGFGY